MGSISISRMTAIRGSPSIEIIACRRASRNCGSFSDATTSTAARTTSCASRPRWSCTAHAAKTASSGRPEARSVSTSASVRRSTTGSNAMRVPPGPVTVATSRAHDATPASWVRTITSPMAPRASRSTPTVAIQRRCLSSSRARCTSTTTQGPRGPSATSTTSGRTSSGFATRSVESVASTSGGSPRRPSVRSRRSRRSGRCAMSATRVSCAGPGIGAAYGTSRGAASRHVARRGLPRGRRGRHTLPEHRLVSIETEACSPRLLTFSKTCGARMLTLPREIVAETKDICTALDAGGVR